MLQGLRANSVEKYRPLGEKFDPNLHEALFEIPDASSEPGTIGAVTKVCYIAYLTVGIEVVHSHVRR